MSPTVATAAAGPRSNDLPTTGTSILPPHLDELLLALAHATRHAVIVRGWSSDCGDGEHRFEVWLAGLYRGRSLVLRTCTNCATVEVRDVSVDRLVGLPTGRAPLRRRDELLGWYSGHRRANRIYHQ